MADATPPPMTSTAPANRYWPTMTPARPKESIDPKSGAGRRREVSVTHAEAPMYPDTAREQGAVGIAFVLVSVDADGRVSRVAIRKSTGNVTLDRAALIAARSSTYSPAIVDCIPTAGSYIFETDFLAQ